MYDNVTIVDTNGNDFDSAIIVQVTARGNNRDETHLCGKDVFWGTEEVGERGALESAVHFLPPLRVRKKPTIITNVLDTWCTTITNHIALHHPKYVSTGNTRASLAYTQTIV